MLRGSKTPTRFLPTMAPGGIFSMLNAEFLSKTHTSRQLALRRWGGWLARWVMGLMLMGAMAGQAMASANWAQTSGPGGGTIQALVIDPSSPSTLYAGTFEGGVFKSTNGGDSWSAVNSGLSSSMFSGGPAKTPVYALAIDPGTPATLYAGTSGNGVFKTTDGGASWSAVNSGLPKTSVYVIAIDPSAPATLYAGTYDAFNGGNVFKSTNGGASWSAVTSGLAISSAVYSLAIDSSRPSTLYAGTDRSVFKSTNGGASWSEVNYTSGDAVRALVIDPGNPATLYEGRGQGGIFKSTNGGARWVAVNTGLTTPFVQSLAIDPSNPATLYAGTAYYDNEGYGRGIFKTTNGGASWSAVNSGLPAVDVRTVVIDPGNPATLYAGTPRGVYKSTNGGASWSAVNSGLAATLVQSVVTDPSSPSTLYAGTVTSGIFKSTDGGVSWSEANSGLTVPAVRALAIDPSNPATLYAGTYFDSSYRGTIFKSTNGGASWSKVNSGREVFAGLSSATPVNAIAIDPSNPATVYVGTYGGEVVFKSTNGGASWSGIKSGLFTNNVYSLAIDPSNPATLYAGSEYSGVFKSTDGGASWRGINSGLSTANTVYSIAIDASAPATLYAGSYGGGVFKSTNGGASWSAVNSGLTATKVYSVVIDPSSPATLHAGTSDGVFKSTDGGASWSAVNSGLSAPTVLSLAIDPHNPDTLYAGTYGGGVFRTVAAPPDAPTTPLATPGNAQATISWTAPANDGGSRITGYTATASNGVSTCTATPPETSCVVTGLANGLPYTFTVVAANAGGSSAPSARSNSVTPAAMPNAPTGLSTTPGNGQVTVGWIAPGSDGGSPITGYTVYALIIGACPDMPVEATCSATLASTCTAPPGATQCTMTGLANGTTYTFRAIATNASGNSAPSAPASAAPTAASAPMGATADPGQAPHAAGNSVTPYALAATPQPVPTLSQSALALLTLLMAGLAGMRLRKATA
jgi:photosystem II stability/assembly factor-like uncharacterized protein